MWWADLLWGFWNGLTAWIVLIVHVFGGWEQFPSTTRREAETGTTSAFCSVPAPLFWVLWAGEGEGATNPPRRTAILALTLTFAGAVVGAIHGLALVWLLRSHRP